ncbi:MAG: quinolinate synthase NadA [Planctomycetota bacterium]
MLWQPPLPDDYRNASPEALAERIEAARSSLGDRLVILGHHYQQDAVIRYADYTGDSFKLSQLAAERVQAAGAEFVVFCGVHFMAETADILTDDHVAVSLPDLSAGCSMADMADYDQTADAWDQLTELYAAEGRRVRLIPVCYMNSSAAIKAFCGQHGGAVCTSSNCAAIFDWALQGGDTPLEPGEEVKVLFLPDQHLGRNTGAAAGYDPATQMALWDPKQDLGGEDEQRLLDATFILWKGHCSVHKLFRPEHVDEVRAEWPDVTVIAHPECSYELCQKADQTGSTERIIEAIETAEAGSRWAIATEVHLVDRLCRAAAERGVEARILSSCQCLCTTMVRINPAQLAWNLEQLAQGKVVNRITVNAEAKRYARIALQRMLDITAGREPGSVSPAAAMPAEAAAGA